MRHGQSRKDARAARHVRIRRKIQGTADRPRMAISFSNKHTNVQFINDDEQRTLIGATTQGGDFEGHRRISEPCRIGRGCFVEKRTG